MIASNLIKIGVAFAVFGVFHVDAFSQTIHKVNPAVDNVSAPSAGSVAGLGWSQRQQIFIDESRLGGLKGKMLRGLVVRRDLDYKNSQRGGDVQLELRMSHATRSASEVSSVFSINTPSTTTKVFDRVVKLPNSPAVISTTKPWGAANSVRIDFTTPFRYDGGTLCIEIIGRPVSGSGPEFWLMDHELVGVAGRIISYGKSCSTFASQGVSLDASTTGAQIGSSLSLTGFGRPGSTPLLVLGMSEIPGGLDLSFAGATGCYQYVNYFLTIRLKYNAPKHSKGAAYTNFQTQIPYDRALLGVNVYFQMADLETTNKTNPAGLTTSNGIKLEISSRVPSLGMSVLRALIKSGTGPLPVSGSVDVESAPVMRLLY